MTEMASKRERGILCLQLKMLIISVNKLESQFMVSDEVHRRIAFEECCRVTQESYFSIKLNMIVRYFNFTDSQVCLIPKEAILPMDDTSCLCLIMCQVLHEYFAFRNLCNETVCIYFTTARKRMHNNAC